MPLTRYALDNFVAQDYSKLTNCQAVAIDHFAQLPYWINNLVLNTMLRTPIKADFKPHIYTMVRRAQSAILDYNEATENLRAFVPDDQHVGVYFRSLRLFEMSIGACYQFFNICRSLAGNVELYSKGDNSALERLAHIYNQSRHPGLAETPEAHLHPVWIVDTGLCSRISVKPSGHREILLRFDELRLKLEEAGRIAEKFSSGTQSQ